MKYINNFIGFMFKAFGAMCNGLEKVYIPFLAGMAVFMVIAVSTPSQEANASTRYVEVASSSNVDRQKPIRLTDAKTEIVTTKYNFKGKACEEVYVVTTFTNGNKCYRRIDNNTFSCVKNAGE